MHFNRSLRHGLPLAMLVLLVVLGAAFHLSTLSELQRQALEEAKSDALHDAAALARAAGLDRDVSHRLVGAEVAADFSFDHSCGLVADSTGAAISKVGHD